MFELPKLPYAYNALEPVISEQALELHHLKHHAGYVKKLNESLSRYEEAKKREDLTVMSKELPSISFNAGGHLNHSFFWECLKPVPSSPKKRLLEALQIEFKGLENFKKAFKEKALSIQGSGWCWLGVYNKHLKIFQTPNHGVSPAEIQPLFVIDIWEHAYYLQYQNRRGDFLDALWQILDWESAEERYTKSL